MPSKKLTPPRVPDCTALLQAMAPHQGASQGISAAKLAEQLGTTRRKLRKHISEARCQGFLVCGHPSTGYFMAVTAEELRMATAFLEHRAFHSLMLLSRMRGVGMAELLGQMRINVA
jgi:biotin operon repressor